ncbi:MAG: HAD hydrolase-like protein [Bacillus subtilis]|nr:HAD hydrolase-like protein [Bacillus subtilis]
MNSRNAATGSVWCTSKFTASALPSLDHYGLTPLFDVIVGLEHVKNHKPHPEPVTEGARGLPVRSSRDGRRHGRRPRRRPRRQDPHLRGGLVASAATASGAEAGSAGLTIVAELIPAIERYDLKEEL